MTLILMDGMWMLQLRSQKAFLIPPGLSFVTASDKAKKQWKNLIYQNII